MRTTASKIQIQRVVEKSEPFIQEIQKPLINFVFGTLKQIKTYSMDFSNPYNLNSAFIDELFDHPTFKLRLQTQINQSSPRGHFSSRDVDDGQVTQVIQEITRILHENQERSSSVITGKFKKQISEVYLEIEKLRDSISLQVSKIEFPTKQLEDDCNLDDEQFYDLPSIKRTINYLQEKAKEISLNSSVVLDSTIGSKDVKNREDAFQDKLTSTMTQMEQSMVCQRESFEENITKRLEKQQKTINNILETLNDIREPALSEKTSNILVASRSATKLKSFFGFK